MERDPRAGPVADRDRVRAVDLVDVVDQVAVADRQAGGLTRPQPRASPATDGRRAASDARRRRAEPRGSAAAAPGGSACRQAPARRRLRGPARRAAARPWTSAGPTRSATSVTPIGPSASAPRTAKARSMDWTLDIGPLSGEFVGSAEFHHTARFHDVEPADRWSHRRARAWPRTSTQEIDLAALSDDELVEQMHDDLYDGMADEIVEGTNILLGRGWARRQGPQRRARRGHADRRHRLPRRHPVRPRGAARRQRDEGRHGDPAPAARRDRRRADRQGRHRHGQGRHPRHRQEPGRR